MRLSARQTRLLSVALIACGLGVSAVWSSSFAQSDYTNVAISGPVTSGVWSGVITMTGDVVINSSETITITPGTRVLAALTSDYSAPESADQRVELIVLGSLVVTGTDSQPITFTSASESPSWAEWYGIRFLAGSSGTIENAFIEYGTHALSLLDDSTLTVRHSTVRQNRHLVTSGHAYASGLYASGNFSLTVENTLFVRNGAYVDRPSFGNVYGGQLYLNGGNTMIRHTQILTPLGIIRSYGGYSRGGGIYATGDGILTIENAQISGMLIHGDRYSYGGGLFLNNTQTVIEDTLISDNTARDEWGGTTSGGGIHITAGTLVTITHSTIERNRAWRDDYAAAPIGTQGGGIYSAGELYLSECIVRDNLIRPYSSGMEGDGAGICIAGGKANIENCVVSGNEITATTRPGYGGGIYIHTGDVEVVNTLIVGNRLTGTPGVNSGGGAFVGGGTVSFVNDTVVDNQVDNDGGGVFFEGNGGITNTIIANNVAGVNGGGIYSGSGNISLGYNDVWGNGNNYFPSTATGIHDISANPAFVNYTGDGTGDYHITSASPCVDAGTAVGAPDTDVDHEVRPSGSGYDIGFDELHQLNLVHLPLIVRDHRAAITFPVHIGDTIPKRPVAYWSEVFYSKSVEIPAQLPPGGHFYFSSQPAPVVPVVVDDELAVLLGGQELFTYDFSTSGHPVPAIVEVPRATMDQIAGQTITLEYRDSYGSFVEASPIWLIWVPS
jgi:hypothetical protein